MDNDFPMMSVTVRHNQGLVKTYAVPKEILLHEFAERVAKFGRFRSVTFGRDIRDHAALALLVDSGSISILK